jgi:hypothetical protein
MKDMTLHPVIGLVVVVAFIAAVFCLMLVPMKPGDSVSGLVNTFLGLLGGMAGMVVSYYFGSSSSSRAKDDTIAAAMKGTGDGSVQRPSSTAADPERTAPRAASL